MCRVVVYEVLDIVEYFQNSIRLPESYLYISNLPKELYLMEWFFFIMSYMEKFTCSFLRKIL